MSLARFQMFVGAAMAFVVAAAPLASAWETGDDAAAKRQADDIAVTVLDDNQSPAVRERLIHENGELAARLVAKMADMPGADENEEYRRIPWIWRVAIAAGKRNDAAQIRQLLEVSLPKPGEPLRDWQAVVVGGGLINGVSLAGHWPKERFTELLESEPALLERWTTSLRLAAAMADDEKVRTGTRYDALRMIALEGWDARGEQLVRYLSPEVDGELQMGAVSALADIDSIDAAKSLLSRMADYNDHNRQLALDALLRSPARATMLLAAIEESRLTPADLGPERIRSLHQHSDAKIRERAVILLPKK